MPKVFRVVVPAVDIDRSSAFYARLFEVPGERVAPDRHYFHVGDVILVCVGRGPAARPNPEPIDFAADDLDAVFARAQAAGCSWLEAKVETRPWGERAFAAKDPLGNTLYFVDEATCFTGFHPPPADDTGQAPTFFAG